MQIRSSRRRGYTLLEVILAVSISVVLIAALYFAMDTQFKHAQAAREVIEESTIVRALLTRITNDLAPVQGPVNPFLNASGAYVNSQTTTSGIGSTANNTAASSSSSSSGSSSSNSSSSSSSSSSTNANVINVSQTNIGVYGDNESVTFTVSRVPRRA